jgi:Tfp pilus assembly protein PilV
MMSACLRRRRREAFTIVEVLMAAVVMLTGVVGMIQVVVSGSEMLDVSRKQTVAAQIIRSEIERLHLSNWSAINAMPSSASVTINPSLQTVSQGFVCTRTITTLSSSPYVRKRVTFTVTWTGNTGRAYTRHGSANFSSFHVPQ